MPHQWYHHSIQARLISLGLKMPVYAKSIAAPFNDVQPPSDTDGICYIAGIGDDKLLDLWDNGMNPILNDGNVNKDALCIFISPPLITFNNEHLLGAKVLNDANGHFKTVISKEQLPWDFEQHVQACVAATLDTIDIHCKEPYIIHGARLNRLSNGQFNIVIIAEFTGQRGCPYDRQTYIKAATAYAAPSSSHSSFYTNPRIRVVPRPTLDKVEHGFNVKFQLVEKGSAKTISVQDFEAMFAAMQTVILNMSPSFVFRHIRINKALDEVIVCCQKRMTNPEDTLSENDYSIVRAHERELCSCIRPTSLVVQNCTIEAIQHPIL